jgi:hypothetical protein
MYPSTVCRADRGGSHHPNLVHDPIDRHDFVRAEQVDATYLGAATAHDRGELDRVVRSIRFLD